MKNKRISIKERLFQIPKSIISEKYVKHYYYKGKDAFIYLKDNYTKVSTSIETLKKHDPSLSIFRPQNHVRRQFLNLADAVVRDAVLENKNWILQQKRVIRVVASLLYYVGFPVFNVFDHITSNLIGFGKFEQSLQSQFDHIEYDNPGELGRYVSWEIFEKNLGLDKKLAKVIVADLQTRIAMPLNLFEKIQEIDDAVLWGLLIKYEYCDSNRVLTKKFCKHPFLEDFEWNQIPISIKTKIEGMLRRYRVGVLDQKGMITEHYKTHKWIFKLNHRLEGIRSKIKLILDNVPGLHYREEVIVNAQGEELKGWFIFANEHTDKIVIVVHGRGSNKKRIVVHSQYITEAGYNVFIMDNRQHGESYKAPITMGVEEGYDLAQAVVDIADKYNQTEICFFGFSMGTFVGNRAHSRLLELKNKYAVENIHRDFHILDPKNLSKKAYEYREARKNLIRRLRIQGIIFDSAPFNANKMFRDMLPGIGERFKAFQTKYQRRRLGIDFMVLDNQEYLSSIKKTPVFLIHCKGDSIVPFEHSQMLADLSDESTMFHWFPDNGDHAEAHLVYGEVYEKKIVSFLNYIFSGIFTYKPAKMSPVLRGVKGLWSYYKGYNKTD